jgi:hypothetical protein
MTLDLRALDRDLDALATGLALPPSDGARGALPALADLDAALAALSAGALPPSSPDAPAAAAPRTASRPAPSRSRPPRGRAARASSAPASRTAAPAEPPAAPVDALAAPAEPPAAPVEALAAPHDAPAAPHEAPAVDLAAQIAESLAGDVEAPSEAALVDVGSDDDFYATLDATADVGPAPDAHPDSEPPTQERASLSAETGPDSEPPTREREALPSSEVAFGDVDPTAFDEEESTSLVSFSSLAVFAERASASVDDEAERAGADDASADVDTSDFAAPAASASGSFDAPPSFDDATSIAAEGAALSAESLFRDAVSPSLLLSNPLDFVAAASPASAPAFEDDSVAAGVGADDDLGERVSVPDDLAALLEGELDPSEFGMPAVAAVAPLADDATRVEDGEFEMFVEEDELFAVADEPVAPGPAPLPATATSPSAAPLVSETAALEGQEKKGFFKKIFGK